jgi:hypothetical protein
MDPDERCMALLTELVAIPECRAFARAGLCSLGEPALEHAARVLESVNTPAVLRRHLPRTISRFRCGRAVEILVAQLAREEDPRVIYKILRGLGRLRADDPSLPVDRATLLGITEKTIERTIELLAYRVADDLLREVAAANPEVADPRETSPEQAHDEVHLLGSLLAEMEQRALERVFRILQVLETGEEFAPMFAALSGNEPAARAGARELIEHVVDGPVRDALLALTDSVAATERLQAAAASVPVSAAETTLRAWRIRTASAPGSEVTEALADVIEAMLSDRNPLLASIAAPRLSSRAAGSPSSPENVHVAS